MAEGTLPFEYLVKRWPVSVETEVISHRTSGAVVVLVAHADGHLSLHIRTYSKSLTEHFQVVRLPVGEYVKIAIAWKSELADLAAKGKKAA